VCGSESSLCIHLSDLVFNGENPPYKENDYTDPLNIYGQQKVTAEQQMRCRYEKCYHLPDAAYVW
jgi:dTDP-4-dehydrorhamnose reductase